jgi:hypothetical protein
MKKKIIIPRRDHEVYFISLPNEIKAKQLQAFITEQLDRLHPTFSSASVFDSQYFLFNKARWAMITVMDAVTFAEYKILNKGAAFYTNTSIAVRQHDFLQGGIKSINDERIGFDVEKNTPISIPLEPENNIECHEQVSQLKAIPARHGVFAKKMPRCCAVLACAVIAVILLTVFVFTFSSKNPTEAHALIIHTEQAAEIKHMPPAIEILARISSDIVHAGGEMLRWQYNEDTELFITVQLRGIDVLTVHQIFEQYEFAFLQDIQNVSYSDGKPYITLNAHAEYAILAANMFPEQNAALPMIIELSNIFQQNTIPIVSETLPTNGNAFYTISYTANDRELIRSLQIISGISGRYPLSVRNADISISGDKQRFTVTCSLAYCERPARNDPQAGKDIIPAAFGYMAPEPPAPQRVNLVIETSPEPPLIGSIMGGGAHITFYRDTSGGRIRIRDNNE